MGLRINPECSTQEGHEIYDPCAPGSRMGTTRAQWDEAILKNPELLDLLDGIHFHTLCEQDSDEILQKTLASVKKKFGDLVSRMKWINFGGGHHITRPGYDIERLKRCIQMAKEEWNVEVYLEPEAWALNAGFLLTSVLDVLKNGKTQLAIVDASAACHMPDVLEMPYRPLLLGADEREEGITVRLGGPTCLSGDVIGDYKFGQLPKYGDLLMFGDMAIYTTCKNNTFNGMPLPDIWLRQADNTMVQLTDFDYTDFKGRLGKAHIAPSFLICTLMI